MILQYLATHKKTLRACSQAAREFRHIALSFIGNHLTVNTVDRLKECAQLIAGGAFQHVRSLDLGINNKRMILEEYWMDYLVVLREFSRYRTLTRLWLSEVPFNFVRHYQKNTLRGAITALGSTVTELGLYGCCFFSYEEMISLIRSFPHCRALFIRDCVTGEQAAGRNAFAGLPEHKLAIKDLQLSSSSSNDLLMDVSNLIEDAALDVGSLTALVCDVGDFEKTQSVAAAVLASPVEQFQVACAEPGGFQGRHNVQLQATMTLILGQSVHGSLIESMDLKVTDNRAANPRDEHPVLGRSVSRSPLASRRAQCHYHMLLPHGQGVQYRLLEVFRPLTHPS